MASPRGRSPARLIDRLHAEPQGFDLFEAVRIAEEAAALAVEAATEPPRVGFQDARAGAGDPVRFRATLPLSFPGGAITGCRDRAAAHTREESAAIEFDIACFGLIGPSGVLPKHYSSLVLERVRRFKDEALRDFLDIFGHRAVSLLYRAWAKYRLAVQHGLRRHDAAERPAVADDDRFARALAALEGLGTPGLAPSDPPGENVFFHYAGTLSRRIASVLPLQQMIGDAWQVPVHIDQFVGRWLQLEPSDQTRLGAPRGGGLAGASNARLGVDAVAGSRVWSVESAIRVRIGPLSWDDFRLWLPGTERLGGLSNLMRYTVGLDRDITICPMLRAADVPPCRVGGGDGGRLGWTTWLVSAAPRNDVDDAEFVVNP